MIKLYDYQIEAIKKLRNGMILCGDVGSGKSLTSIGYYYVKNGGDINCLSNGRYKEMKNPVDIYIITTARKRDTFEWDNELSHFLLSTDPKVNRYKNKVVIDSWNNIKKYVGVKGSFFIFDEDRVVGNGAWVKAFLKITNNNKWILLSATPGDTWSDYIPVFIANGFYKNRTAFIDEHVVYRPRAPFPQIQRYLNTSKLDKLRSVILLKMKDRRHTKQNRIDIWCNYDFLRYKEVMKTKINPYKEMKIGNKTIRKPIESASEFCSVLRRIINSDEDRLKQVINIIRDKKKAIIFYNFNYELELLKRVLSENDILFKEWNGTKHEELPIGKEWAYLVQYNAGAEGWNCITTDTIIFYSQNYSYKTMVQAAGRINRINTPYKDLYFYSLRTKSSIDLAISRTLRNKKKFNEREFGQKLLV